MSLSRTPARPRARLGSRLRGLATSRLGCATLVLLAVSLQTDIGAQGLRAQTVAPVFQGDPVGPDGEPYPILPGLPLFLPGEDEEYGTSDDTIDSAIVGDVDLVVRAGGTYQGGAIPPPASGVALAPAVVPGGTGTGAGTGVAFQVILSDGRPAPPTGNALLGAEHDGRGALVVAYPDLDGDGVIGPTNADGSADNQVEMQETLSPAGRQVAVIVGGVAAGALGVSLGAPASAGGLGMALVGGALIGKSASAHYFDGPWVSTLLPFMPPIDPTRIIGRGNVRPPDPERLVEVTLEGERFGRLAPGHAVLGTPFAIPLDGSSVTVDVVRSVAGSAMAAKLLSPVDPATFVAASTRRVLAAVDPAGQRMAVEAVDALPLSDDGSGNGRTLFLVAADLFGNPTDPAPSVTVALELDPALALVEPDADGDPERENVVLADGRAVLLRVDDAGGAGDGGSSARITATVGGLPTDSVRFVLAPGGGGGGGGGGDGGGGGGGGGGGAQTFTLRIARAGDGDGTATTSQGGIPCGTDCTVWPSGAQVTLTSVAGAGSEFVGWSGCGITTNPGVVTMSADRTCTATFSLVSTDAPGPLLARRTRLGFGWRPGRGRLSSDAGFVAEGASFDPAGAEVIVTLREGAGAVVYSRTLPAGSLTPAGTSFSYSDARGDGSAHVAALVVRGPRSPRDQGEHRVRLTVRNVDFGALARGPTRLTQTLRIGARTYQATLACTPNARGSALICVP
jgi:hypothetical protein